MNKNIETTINKLKYKISILEKLERVISEFNLIPNHTIKFKVIEYGGSYFIYFGKLTEIDTINKINSILYKISHRFHNYAYKDYWEYCKFIKTTSVYKLFLVEGSQSSNSKSTIITLDDTKYLDLLFNCITEYIELYKNNLLENHINETKIHK